MKSKGFQGKTATLHYLKVSFSLKLERFIDNTIPTNSEKQTDSEPKTKPSCINEGKWKDNHFKSAGVLSRTRSKPYSGV